MGSHVTKFNNVIDLQKSKQSTVSLLLSDYEKGRVDLALVALEHIIKNGTHDPSKFFKAIIDDAKKLRDIRSGKQRD